MTIARRLFVSLLMLAALAGTAGAQNWNRMNGPRGATILTITHDTASNRYWLGSVGTGVVSTSSIYMNTTSRYAAPLPAGDSVRAVLAWSAQRIIAASERGLYRSDDTGWTWIPSVLPGAAPVLALERAGSMLVAATAGTGVYTSADSGATWKPSSLASGRVTALAEDAQRSLYAATVSGIMRSTDHGATWFARGFSSQPTSFVAADSLGVYASVRATIWRSTDEGASWLEVGSPLPLPVTALAAFGRRPVLAGTDAGIWQLDSTRNGWMRSGAQLHPVRALLLRTNLDYAAAGFEDAGLAARYRQDAWSWATGTLSASRVEALAASDQTERIYAITRAHALDVTTYNRGSWTLVNPDPNFHAARTGALGMGDDGWYLGGDSGRVFASTNTGAQWQARHIPVDVRVSAFAVDDVGTVWAATAGRGVARSTNRGVDWTLHEEGLLDLLVTGIVALPDGTIVAGSASGGLYRWDTSGQGWIATHPAAGSAIVALAADAFGTVYAALPSALLRSTDAGATWEGRTRPAPGRIVALAAGGTAGRVFAAYEQSAVYRSDDGGATWMARSNGLTGRPLTSMVVDYHGSVYVGTEGSGVLVADSAMYPTRVKRVVLELPAPGAVVDKGTLNLMWTKAGTGVTYDVQVSRDSTFTVIDNDTTDLHETAHLPLLVNNNRYYWRVRAVVGSVPGPWSYVRWFRLAVPRPEAPVLNAPQDGATDIPTEAPFSWNSAKGAVTFDLQLSFSPSFDTLQREVTEIPRIYVTVGALRAMRTYYWRVRGRGIYDVGPWSEVRRFTTWLRVPPPPLLLIPTNGVASVPTTALLRWNPADAAVTYRVQVAKSAAFFPVLMDIDLIAGTSRQITALDPLTTYYWRVLGRNSVGEGLWSAAWSFTTDDGAPPPPLLLVPAHEATHVVQQGGVLRWSRVPNALRYHLQLARDESFATVVLDKDALTDTTYPAGSLARGTAYAWRVRSAGASGVGAWSPASVFTTARGVPDVPVALSPADGAVSQPLSPELAWQPSPWADTHLLQLATDAAFTSLVVDTVLTQTTCSVGPLADSATFFWRLAARNDEGMSAWSTARRFTTVRVTGIDAPIASVLSLAVHPHPVRTRAIVTFELDAASVVRIELLDLLGRTLGTVADGFRVAGRHEIQVDVQDLPAGTVLVRATAAGRPPMIRILHIIH